MGKKKRRKECLEFLCQHIMGDYDHVSPEYKRKMVVSLLEDALSYRTVPELKVLVKRHTPVELFPPGLVDIFEMLTALKAVRSMARQLILFEDDPVTDTVKDLYHEILKTCEDVVRTDTE